jgi:hypothetical protein
MSMTKLWNDTGRERFWSGVRGATQACLQFIGYPGEARVSLIPIPEFGASDSEDRPSKPFSHLNPSETWARAALESEKSAGGRPPNDNYCLSVATEAGLTSHPHGAGWSFFVSSRSAHADAHHTFIATALRNDDLYAVPHVGTALADDPLLTVVHAVVRHVLYRAGLLLASDPNDSDILVLHRHAPELVRTATANFVGRVLHADPSHADHDQLLNSISALPYEGRSGSGAIIAVPPHAELARIKLRLKRSIPIKNTRAVRKLMEVTTENNNLLLYDGSIYGLGTVEDPEEGATEEPTTAFRITGRGTWQLEHQGRALVQVRDGLSRLPSAAIDMAMDSVGLHERLAWLLPDANVNALTKLAKKLQGSTHGAMLIISGKAAQEAARFGAQACPVEPAELVPEVAASLTEMDGGILVDEQGFCHAIGLILDGHTGAREDFARGSRYNNAIRYLALDGEAESSPGSTRTIVIVYSSDGMVDMLPPLYPRKPAALIGRIVEDLIEAISSSTSDNDKIGRLLSLTEANRFYLSEAQCAEINNSIGATLLWPSSIPRPRRFNPDPRMNAERFLY